MPRRKCCQHPTRHANSASSAKGTIPVSSQLSKFLISQYDLTDTHIRWLCPKCHSFETKDMENYEPMETTGSRSSSDNQSVRENSHTEDDDSIQEGEIDYDNQEDKDHDYTDSDMEDESMDDDDNDDHLCMNDDEDDPESMDDEPEDDSHDLAYQQKEAMKKLSTIFQLLNIAPIHDK
jgi:hypothetical protein